MSDVRKCKGKAVRTESKDLAPHHPALPIEPAEPLSKTSKGRHIPQSNPQSRNERLEIRDWQPGKHTLLRHDPSSVACLDPLYFSRYNKFAKRIQQLIACKKKNPRERLRPHGGSSFSKRKNHLQAYQALRPLSVKPFAKEGYDEAIYKILVEAGSAVESAFP